MNYKFVGNYSIGGIEDASLNEVKEFLDDCQEFCIDIETTGLCPHQNKIIMLQVGNTERQYIIDVRCTNIKSLIPYITDPSTKKIGTNLKFEYKMFLGNLNCRMQNPVDVMINEVILTCGIQRSGFSLETLARKYLNIELPKEVRLEFTRIGNAPFEARHVRYGAGDVYYPQLINNIQQDILKLDNLLTVARLEYNVLKVMGEMEYNGMPINHQRWLDIAHENSLMSKEKLKELDKYIIDNQISKYYIPENLFNSTPKCTAKWTSPKEVASVFQTLGIPTKILDKEKTKRAEEEYGIEMEFFKDSVGGPELAQYSKEFPIIPLYTDYQKYNKASTTFGDKWLNDNVNPITGRIHSSFWSILATGRSSSAKPNVQQIPCFKDKDFHPSYQAHRTCFEAIKGSKFIVKDYSGQELVVLAEMSSEEAMIDEFVNGTGDLHSLTASKIYSQIRGEYVEVNKKVNSGLRQVGKTINFALVNI